MSINGINSSNLNSLAPTGMEGNYLTPDALMSFCASRLRNLDDQVQTAFATQKRANADSSVLADLQRELGKASSSGLSGKENIGPAVERAGKAFIEAANKTNDPDLKKKLIDQASKLGNVMLDKDGKALWAGAKTDSNSEIVLDGQTVKDLSADQFKHLTSDAVEGFQKDINAGTELSMINLQSLMSQRQSSVQLITNLVQSLGDQINKVAANVGH